MNNIKNWLNIITNNELHAYNKVSSRDLALCINFLQIPDTSAIVLTVTVMKNKVKKNALPPLSFCRVLSCIEDRFETLLDIYTNEPDYDDEDEDVFFRSIKSDLTNRWYIQLCCHRLFFIPDSYLWKTVESLFTQEVVQEIKSYGITEISVYMNTEKYDCNAKFY